MVIQKVYVVKFVLINIVVLHLKKIKLEFIFILSKENSNLFLRIQNYQKFVQQLKLNQNQQ
jgi:hypothetical protein